MSPTRRQSKRSRRFMTGVLPPPQPKVPFEHPRQLEQRRRANSKAKAGDPRLDNPDEYLVAPAAKPTAAPVPRYSRRALLVELAVNDKNPYFARAMVNRVWAWLIGRGLVEPLDQMHSANPATHPELFKALSAQFVASGYDFRVLIGGLVKRSRLPAFQPLARRPRPAGGRPVRRRPASATLVASARDQPALRRRVFPRRRQRSAGVRETAGQTVHQVLEAPRSQE